VGEYEGMAIQFKDGQYIWKRDVNNERVASIQSSSSSSPKSILMSKKTQEMLTPSSSSSFQISSPRHHIPLGKERRRLEKEREELKRLKREEVERDLLNVKRSLYDQVLSNVQEVDEQYQLGEEEMRSIQSQDSTDMLDEQQQQEGEGGGEEDWVEDEENISLSEVLINSELVLKEEEYNVDKEKMKLEEEMEYLSSPEVQMKLYLEGIYENGNETKKGVLTSFSSSSTHSLTSSNNNNTQI